MTGGWLKKLGDTQKKIPPIKRLLHDSMGQDRQSRSHKTLHASEVTHEDREFCPREYALRDLLGKEVKSPREYIQTSLRYTFEMGEWVQYQINNVWLRDYMIGDWRCASCGATRLLTSAPKGHCGKSGIVCNWEYQEIRLKDPFTGISGGIDGFVNIGKPKLRMLEVKILDKDQFKALLAPKSEHRIRTRLYLRLLERAEGWFTETVDTSCATILYCSRAFGNKDEQLEGHHEMFSPFKEYRIDRNDEDIQTLLHQARSLQEFRLARHTGSNDPQSPVEDLPIPAPICPSVGCPRAKKCPVRQWCFSPEFPARTTWLNNGKPVHSHLPIVETP